MAAELKRILTLADRLCEAYLANRRLDERHWFLTGISGPHGGRAGMLKDPNSVAAHWVELSDLVTETKTGADCTMDKDKSIAMLRAELKNLMDEWYDLELPPFPECPRCNVSTPDDGGDYCPWHRAFSVLDKTDSA